MNVLSLFAGIGGLDLGLERAGMTVVGQVEIDPFCRRVLERHWPDVPRHDDVRTAVAWWVRRGAPAVDVVAGGFPCQPFSTAGLRRGVTDERWGWPWMADVVRAVRPRFVVVENVPALLADRDAFGWLLADLVTLGFDAEGAVVGLAQHTEHRLGALGQRVPAGVAERGLFQIDIAGTYPLDQVAEAHRQSQTGHVSGKIVLVPTP